MTIKKGDIVSCRYFNTPEGRFYGKRFDAKVIREDISFYHGNHSRPFLVEKLDSGFTLRMARKEVRRK